MLFFSILIFGRRKHSQAPKWSSVLSFLDKFDVCLDAIAPRTPTDQLDTCSSFFIWCVFFSFSKYVAFDGFLVLVFYGW